MIKKKDIKKIDDALANVRGIIRHIKNVQDNSILLGEKLIEIGEIELGKSLIAHGFKHDNSKFFGIEWQEMAPMSVKSESIDKETKKLKLKLAITNHNQVNLHHVEAWTGGINDMPDVYLCEMLCDIKARSEEFGTSLMDYIDNEGIKRWNVSKEDEVYKRIIKFVNLLCEKPFSTIN